MTANDPTRPLRHPAVTPGFYGLVLGIVMVLCMKLPQPTGSLIFWSLIALQLSCFAVVCWRRTRLPFMTAGSTVGAVMSLSVATIAALGTPYPDLPREAWVMFVGGALLVPAFLLIESRANNEKWRAWSQHMRRSSLWDMLVMRHVPLLRGRPGRDNA